VLKHTLTPLAQFHGSRPQRQRSTPLYGMTEQRPN